MIEYSNRLRNVVRVFDPYQDRTGYIRLDRNEDPTGYPDVLFEKWKSQLGIDDVAAYADSTKLIEKIAAWLNIATESIYITAGSDALIKNIFEVYIDQGDVVLTQNPSWRMYDVYAAIYGAKTEYITYNSDFYISTQEIIDKINNEKIRMLILANPNQPTGTLIDKTDLEKILDAAKNNGTLVIVDEAYYLFTDETSIEFLKTYENLIIARTFSKAFGLAGLRIGYAIANPQRIDELKIVRPVTDANSLAINFACFLLDHMSIVQEKINDFNQGRDYIYEAMEKSNLKCYKSYGNFLLIPCINEESAHMLMGLAKQNKYLLKGPFKFEPLINFVRISTGPLHLMQKFWTDCGDAIIKYAIKVSNGENRYDN